MSEVNVAENLKAVKRIEKKSQTFSGCAEGTKTTVRYIIETESIEP